MQRFDQYGPLDDQPKPLGDRGFIGVNMRLDAAQLAPGYVSEAVNMRFRNGIAETRLGFTVLPWTNKIVSGQTQPWGTVHGTGVFSDPFTLQEYLVIAADGAAYYTQAGNTPQTLSLGGGGVTLTGDVSFTQAFDTLIMHRGPTADTLQMPRISQGFALVQQTPSGDGTYPIPNATHALYLQNRLFIPNDNDEIAASDLNDFTRFVPVLQEFKINQGSADELVAGVKFNDTTIVAFKEHSIYAISNVYGDLNALQQDELTNQFGLVARKSVAHVGKDLWFLSELGVMSITQTEQNKLQGVVLPVSDPIQPLIERINWRYAHNACGAVWDSKYYLAVPLDDAEVVQESLLNNLMVWDGLGYTVSVRQGATYRFVRGDDEPTLTNGTETLTRSGDFVAQGTTVTLTGQTGPVIQSTLERVIKGVNNAVLVYDFLNQAWSGHDEAPGVAFRDFFQFTYNGKRRLFAITPDGYVLLYEEDDEDQLMVPYTDLTETVSGSAVTPGATLQVNGGTVVTASAPDVTVNAGDQWGCASGGGSRLFVDSNATPGFGAGYAIPPWSAPNTRTVAVTNGVRFYATNGVIPAIVTTADWVTINEVGTQPVQSLLLTRGYSSDVQALSDYEWLICDLQTWAPEFSVDVIVSGVNEEQVIAEEETKDRAAYYEPSDAEPFDLSNSNGDFLEPKREDYSVLLGDVDGGTEEFALHTVADGVPIELHQEHRLTERVNLEGRTAQVRIANSQGRIRVMSVALEADEETINAGEKA